MVVSSKRHAQDVRLVIQYQTHLAHDCNCYYWKPYFQYFAIVCQILCWVFQASVLLGRFLIQRSLANNKLAYRDSNAHHWATLPQHRTYAIEVADYIADLNQLTVSPVVFYPDMHLRYPASAGQPPPKVPSPTPPYTTATSFASIRLDQGLVIYRKYDIYSPIRIRAVPGTQQGPGDQLGKVGTLFFLAIDLFELKFSTAFLAYPSDSDPVFCIKKTLRNNVNIIIL